MLPALAEYAIDPKRAFISVRLGLVSQDYICGSTGMSGFAIRLARREDAASIALLSRDTIEAGLPWRSPFQ